jgi:hypothetical protein
MKQRFLKFVILNFTAIVVLLANCNLFNDPPKVTKIETTSVTEITATSAKAGLEFTDLSGNVTEFGHCWNTGGSPTISNSKSTISANADKKEFFSELTDLNPNTKYYVKAFAREGNSIIYGDEIEFKTFENKSIIITSPAANRVWECGINDTIKWNDNIDENVKIELYKGGNKLPDITTSTESDGIYEWTPEKSLSPANNYSIKIISVKDINILATTNYFTIAEARYININKPVTGATWIKGSANLIEWTSNISENLNI